MTDYFLQLGHAPELSFAEIAAAQQRHAESVSSPRFGQDIALLSSDSSSLVSRFSDELGGTIRVCEQLGEKSDKPADSPSDLVDWLAEFFRETQIPERLRSQSNRPIFGLSLIGEVKALGSRKTLQRVIQGTASELKKILRERETSTRFVLPSGDSDSYSLNAAQVDKNELLQKGGEIVLHIASTGEIRLGLTRWIQKFEEFSQRDYGRPQRDSKSGMLPPKLSRMLINLAREKNTRTLLDPFCGSGSLLVEAALMGLQATGVDIGKKAVQDTQANWKWFLENVSGVSGRVKAFEADVRQLHKKLEPLSFDCCVTEPYMGPPLKKPLRQDEFQKRSQELSELYLRALGEIRIVVKPGARVVFIVPRFRVEGSEKASSLNILPALKLQGYTIVDPLKGFQPSKGRSTLLYARPQQWVQREIFVMQA